MQWSYSRFFWKNKSLFTQLGREMKAEVMNLLTIAETSFAAAFNNDPSLTGLEGRVTRA